MKLVAVPFFILSLATQAMGWFAIFSGELPKAFASFCISLVCGLYVVYFNRRSS